MAMKLIQNYHVMGPIVISKDATPAEEYAARELRYYFNIMTARAVTIEKAAEKMDDAVIVLGSALPLYGEKRETYEDDELHWYTKDGKIFFDGGKRGFLYGIYDFLEFLGCRFYAVDCEKIPTAEELSIPDTDRRDKPALEYRDVYRGDYHHNHRFALKHRINAGNLPESLGGSISFAIGCHSFCRLLPYSKYGKEHPEWYALCDGSRNHDEETRDHRIQLCLSNPEVTEMLIQKTRETLLQHPEAKLMSISINDTDRPCECEACRAIDEEEGCPSGLLIRVVNAVAEALEPEFPNIMFETLAYVYARPAPNITKPRHNVCIRLCSMEVCFSHPIETCRSVVTMHETYDLKEGEKSFADNVRDWGKIAKCLYIWDYVTCFWHYYRPQPNWHTIPANMRFFYENGVRGMFAQSNVNGNTDMEELRAYLLSKLMWDPYVDAEEIIREFTDYYYGAAGVYVREYIETMCKKCEDENIHISCYGRSDPEYLSPEMLAIYHAILDKAEAAVRDDVIRRMRVSKIRLCLKYVEMRAETMDGGTSPEKIKEFLDGFFVYDDGNYLEEGTNYPRSVQAWAEGAKHAYMASLYEGENKNGNNRL